MFLVIKDLVWSFLVIKDLVWSFVVIKRFGLIKFWKLPKKKNGFSYSNAEVVHFINAFDWSKIWFSNAEVVHFINAFWLIKRFGFQTLKWFISLTRRHFTNTITKITPLFFHFFFTTNRWNWPFFFCSRINVVWNYVHFFHRFLSFRPKSPQENARGQIW